MFFFRLPGGIFGVTEGSDTGAFCCASLLNDLRARRSLLPVRSFC